jgi:hypothetical protein
VNHKVHLFIRGCLTLKLSGSWNTVICSSLDEPFELLFSSWPFAPSGEMGIVERSTWEDGSPLTAAAMVAVVGNEMIRRDETFRKNRAEVGGWWWMQSVIRGGKVNVMNVGGTRDGWTEDGRERNASSDLICEGRRLLAPGN